MIYTTIDEKVSAALTALILPMAAQLEIKPANIKGGIANDDLELPCVVSFVERYVEKIHDSGIYEVSALVRIKSQASDTAPALHNKRIGLICDKLRADSIAEMLSALTPNFYVHQLVFGEGQPTIVESAWVHDQALTLFCQPSTF